MGADHSCPCNGDSNVYFPPEEGDDGDAIVVARKVPNSPTATTLNTGQATSLEKGRGLPADSAPISKGKSRKWNAQPKDGSGGVDLSSTSTQRPGDETLGDGESVVRDDFDGGGESGFGDGKPGGEHRREHGTSSQSVVDEASSALILPAAPA
eukprot:g4780.t1